jgi:hypothetical protein
MGREDAGTSRNRTDRPWTKRDIEPTGLDGCNYSPGKRPHAAPRTGLKVAATNLEKPEPDQLRSLLSSVPRAVLKQMLQEISDQEQIEAKRQ